MNDPLTLLGYAKCGCLVFAGRADGDSAADVLAILKGGGRVESCTTEEAKAIVRTRFGHECGAEWGDAPKLPGM